MQGEQEDTGPGEPLDELIERLRTLDRQQSAGSLSELAYKRARDALEKALEDAARIRLQALDDARSAREREVRLLGEALAALRRSAEAEVEAVLSAARIEAEQTRARARQDAETRVEEARRQVEAMIAEARVVRDAAEERARQIERLEAEFNDLVDRFAERVGMNEKPKEGWLARLFRRR